MQCADRGTRRVHRAAGGIHTAGDLQPREPVEARLPGRGASRATEPCPSSGPAGRSGTAMSEAAIDVHGLTKRFDNRAVVDDFAIRVDRGQIFGFLGPNGSGKTTTIRMLCGLLTPDAGEGTCLGYNIRTEASKIKREVGYMTQRFSLYEDLSIEENLDFVARMYAVQDRRKTVESSLERLGLAPRRAQLAGALSGGWKQRLALAACLLHSPVAFARRTHGRRRSESAPRLLGAHPRSCSRRHDGSRQHALHGRGRALSPACVPFIREAARDRFRHRSDRAFRAVDVDRHGARRR